MRSHAPRPVLPRDDVLGSAADAVAPAILYVVEAIQESLVEADLLSRAARATRAALACDWTLLTVWDAGRKAFRGAAADGWEAVLDEHLLLAEFRPDTLEWFKDLAAGRLVEVTRPPADLRVFCRQWGVSSFMGVPMRRPGTLLGAMLAGFRRRNQTFTDVEKRTATGIAEHVATAIENVRALESVRRTSRLKTDILATISHELRTPLNAILGYSDLMRDGAMGSINAEQAQALDRILFNGRTLMEMIGMALDLNRLDAGRLSVHASEFRLQEVLTELSNEFAARPVNTSVRLVWPEYSDVPTLWTDRAMLKVALRNLINNALKFTPRGHVAVAVDCSEVRGRVRISVSDTGVGIPREQQASIFDMFAQGPQKATGRGGVGLGLYLVRSYTELMGGTVTVESTPGKGSTFTVDLPWHTGGAAPLAGKRPDSDVR